LARATPPETPAAPQRVYVCYRVAGALACSAQRRFSAKVAPQQICATDVSFGSEADILERLSDVCFTPESGHPSAKQECGLCGRLCC
jgi:hypothetical protein